MHARQDGVSPWLACNNLNTDECKQFEGVMFWLMYPERFAKELRAAGFKLREFSAEFRRQRDHLIATIDNYVPPSDIGPHIEWRLAA